MTEQQEMTDRYHARVAEVAGDLLAGLQEGLEKHAVTHDEYRAAWAWLMGLADSGEVPLFLDVFFESVVERTTFDDRPGSRGTVQGPYHLDGAPELTTRPFVLPMRPDEPGEPLVFAGRVLSLDGSPIDGATFDMWQAGNDGTYSGFVGDAPRTNLRGRFATDAEGAAQVRTIRPAPYQIPDSGPTGQFLGMLGRHTWRPAHLHFAVSAPGHEQLITQLYFADGPWLDDDGDVVGAVKDELVVPLQDSLPAHLQGAYGLPESTSYCEYTFVLRPEAGEGS